MPLAPFSFDFPFTFFTEVFGFAVVLVWAASPFGFAQDVLPPAGNPEAPANKNLVIPRSMVHSSEGFFVPATLVRRASAFSNCGLDNMSAISRSIHRRM